MTLRFGSVLAAAFLLLAPAAGQAAMSSYTQNFESLVQTDAAALSGDGWIVYGNVFNPGGTRLYGYGTFPAPNGTGAFCAIDVGQGGTEQGTQQLSVYSDYNNVSAHTAGNLVQSLVFHEQTIGALDVGTQWTLQFDAKLGNLAGATTAQAFIKTLDPAHGYVQTNLVALDMTAIPGTWNTYTITISIATAGQLVQFGFSSTATHFEGSGVFYDNVVWSQTGTTDVGGGPRSNTLELGAPAPNPFQNSTRIDCSLAQRGMVDLSVFDIAGRRVATLVHGEADPGPRGATWDGLYTDGRRAPPGMYRCVLQTAAGRRTRSLVLSR